MMDRKAPTRYFEDVAHCVSQGDARQFALANPRRIAIVQRGIPRAAVFGCPCGCGEIISVNLDPRTGRAWRLFEQPHAASLLPSVWLAAGCRSHFFVWKNDVWWCGDSWNDDWVDEVDEDTSDRWFSTARTDSLSRRKD